jgi:small subunit ribosomal protein S8
MSMTDPIADLLTRIRNATTARHDKTEMPWSRLKEQVARVLLAEGYVRDVVAGGQGATKTLTVLLRYTDAGEPAISGIRRISRPGMRVYTPAADAPVVRKGLGVSILSTPAGLLVDREARRRNVGGEIICEVW